jgi:hypothetical protein
MNIGKEYSSFPLTLAVSNFTVIISNRSGNQLPRPLLAHFFLKKGPSVDGYYCSVRQM